MSEQIPRFKRGDKAILKPVEDGTPQCLIDQFGTEVPYDVHDVDDAPESATHPDLVWLQGPTGLRKISGAWLRPLLA
ncbi:MAG: hypothetical protein HY341_01670 [Candidatus Kerfeldbacteria bacterium]|nr:hypothetical protein [Candidatus Kerfeldbacteria bacterium]